MNPKLTERQEQMLAFLHSYIAEHRYPPTLREIGEATDLGSVSNVAYHLSKLERKGYLERDEGKSRAIRLLVDPPIKYEVPA